MYTLPDLPSEVVATYAHSDSVLSIPVRAPKYAERDELDPDIEPSAYSPG